jgi:flagellin
MIAITDGAMNEITSSLIRLAELAEQSANGVYDTNQRSALQLEFTAVSSEIQRIAETTEFNGLRLLSDSNSVAFQVGFDGNSNSQITFSSVQATLESVGLRANATAGLTYSINDTTNLGAQSAAKSALNAISLAIDSLTRNRGTLGAVESRLNISIQNLQVARENFAAAESRIRDVDVAYEAAELTRLNILQQASTSILAQANQQPSLALTLLQG